MALIYKVSNINSFVGTGKSHTLATFILIMTHMGYKVLVCALINVTIDSILERV